MKTARTILLILSIGLLLAAAYAWAQDEGGESAEPAPDAAAAPAPAENAFPQLLNLNLEWVNSDLTRLVEELRLAKTPWEKRDLIEQVEYLIYKHVEYPLVFKQAELSDQRDLERIGTTSDVVDAGSANPLAPLIAEAFALYGIAKGYEGYASAANDQIDRAKKIYPPVEDLTVKLDNFKDRQTIKTWITESMGNWASTNAVRVSVVGKSVNQQSVDKLTKNNLSFAAVGHDVSAYYLAVAQADFLRGLRRYIVTEDRLTTRRPNNFQFYLPPGKYALKTDVSNRVPVEFEVSSDPAKNIFIVESLEEAVTMYPRPVVKKENEK